MITAGVCLSGCGVYDGSEIHEAVLTLLALDRAEAQVLCCAPDVDFDVVDHLTGERTGERRNVLVESARIARGAVRDVASVAAEELDCLIFPGGFGAAQNLCDFAQKGAAASVQPDVRALVRGMLALHKPIGAICIAPALLACVLGEAGIAARLTIGNEAETAAAIESLGLRHVVCTVGEICTDADHGIVSTPAYMLAQRISEAARGIERLVAEVLERAAQGATR